MRRCIPALGALGDLTGDLSHVGWDGSDAAIEQLRSELTKLGELENSIYVLDLLTSTSYRFIQADGSLALPVKIGLKFHNLGEVSVCDDKMLKSAIKKSCRS